MSSTSCANGTSLLWCEAWGGWGTDWCLWVGGCCVGREGGLTPGLWWGVADGSSPADECGLSSALILSLYFPYPFCPCISHTHRTNCLPPILLVPLRAPYFPQQRYSCTHSLMLRAAVLCHTKWLVVDLSPKMFLTYLLDCLRAGQWVG